MEGGHQGVGNGVWKNPEVHTGGVHFRFGALQFPCALVSVKAPNLFEGSHNLVLVGETPPYSWVHVTQAWPSRHQSPLMTVMGSGMSMRPSSAAEPRAPIPDLYCPPSLHEQEVT